MPERRLRIVSRALSAAFTTVSSKLAKRLFALDRVSAVDVIHSFGNHPVNFFRCIFFAEIARQDIMINRAIEKVVGVRRAARLHLVFDKPLKLWLQRYIHGSASR